MKKYILVFLVMALFLVSGQKGCEGPGKQAAQITDVIGIDFVEQRPPNEVLDNNLDPFYISLKLKNNGDYTVPAHTIFASITSLSKDAFKLENLHSTFNSELVSKVDNIVAEEEFELSRSSYQYDLTKDFDTKIDVNVCYPYQSRAIFNVCLKRKAIERVETAESCVVNSNLNAENQAAPIQIIDVSQKAIGMGKIRLTFTVKNTGGGEIYAPASFSEKCLENEDNKGIVKLMVFSKSVPVKCVSLEQGDRGTVRLSDGIKIIMCDINTENIPQTTAFEEQFEVKSEYYSKYKISKVLKVVNAIE